MAPELSAAITVEQTLHGYDDGHRRLAGSFRATPAGARTMLVLSDLSSSTSRIGRSGYLTGYPLNPDGRYVVARTWAATEMPRPGCVWTHSLVIQFADLAVLTTALPLLRMFQRPEGDLEGYGVSRQVPVDGATVALEETRTLDQIVQALYGEPDRKVVSQIEEPEADERIMLAIWMQQWPRLRRSFRFCSHAGADRSTAADSFDLQLVQSVDRIGLARFPGAIAAVDSTPIHDLRPSIDDLIDPDATGLRSFLRTVGGDMTGGRAAVVDLCRLHALLRDPTAENLSAAVEPLEAMGPTQGRAARELAASAALDLTTGLDEGLVEFTILNTPMDDVGGSQRARLGRFLWRHAPRRFASALSDGGPLGNAVRSSLRDLSAAQVIAGLARHPELVAQVVEARPALLEEPEFWMLPGTGRDLLVSSQVASDTGGVLHAVVRAGRRDLARDLFRDRSLRDVLLVLFSVEPPDPQDLSRWYEMVAWDRWQIAAALAEVEGAARGSLAALSMVVDPDDIPNDYGDDPWWIAYSKSSGTGEATGEVLLAAFLMVRALGWRSRSPAHLLRATFDRVHAALAGDSLHGRARRLLDRRFSWSTRRERDAAARLRDAVVTRFVDARLDPETFGRLTDDGGLWKSLADLAAGTGRGRDFLKDVAVTIIGASEPGIRQRAAYIAEVTGRR